MSLETAGNMTLGEPLNSICDARGEVAFAAQGRSV